MAERTPGTDLRASRTPRPARVFAFLLVLVLGSVSSRTMAAEDSSLTRESRKPKASRRALLAATSRTTVPAAAETPVSDAPPPREAVAAFPTWRAAPLSLRTDRALLLQTSRPEYLRPYSRSLPSGFLSPPA